MNDQPTNPEIPTSMPSDIDRIPIRFRVISVDKDEKMPVPGPNGGVLMLTRRKIDVQGHLFTVHTNAIHWFNSVPAENAQPGQPPIWMLKARVVRLVERGAVRYHSTIDKGIFSVMVPEYCSVTEAKTIIIENMNHIKDLDDRGALWSKRTKK